MGGIKRHGARKSCFNSRDIFIDNFATRIYGVIYYSRLLDELHFILGGSLYT